jgi:hypothetical protein
MEVFGMIQIAGSHLSQWDVGRSVSVSDSKATHVHFANQGDSKAPIIKIENGEAKIPDYLLQTGKALNAYAVLDGVTLESRSFAVCKRERPENYVYEDDRRNYIYELITSAEAAVENANQAAQNANEAAEKIGSIVIPTKVSQLQNDSGFLTEAPVTSVNGLNGDVSTATKVSLTEQTDGSYLSDLSSAEIMAAYRDHKSVHCYHNKMILPLIRSVVNDAVFSGIYNGQIHTVNVTSNRVATVTVIPLASGGGSDGITPHIGANGNWWIGEEDTGVSAGVTDEQISGAVEEYMEENPLVKTVNGTAPDENGNVVLDIPSGGGGGGGLKATELIYELVVSEEGVLTIDVPIDIRKYEHFRIWIETNVNSKTFRIGLIDASGKNYYLTVNGNVQIYNSAVADFSILSNDLVDFKGLRTSFRNKYGAMDGGLSVGPIVVNIEASSIRLYREDHFKIGEIVRLYAVPWG